MSLRQQPPHDATADTSDVSGNPPLPSGASDAELRERVEVSREMAEINLSFGESEADADNAVSLLEDAFAHACRLRDPGQREAVSQELASMIAQTRAADPVQHEAEEAELAAAISLSLSQDADADDATDEALLAWALRLQEVAMSHIDRNEDGDARIERYEDALRALELLQQAHTYASRLRNPNFDVGQSLMSSIGQIQFALSEQQAREGRLDESIQLCERALVSLCDAGDRSREITARTRLGLMLAKQGRHEQAADQIERLRAAGATEGCLLHMLSRRQRKVRRLGDVAEAHLAVGETEAAVDRLRQALNLCSEASDRVQLLRALCESLYQLRDYNSVVELSTEVMELSLQNASLGATFEDEDVKVLLLCAKAFFYDGSREDGLARCEQMLAILRMVPGGRGSKRESEVLLTLGIMCHQDKQHERAATYLRAQLANANRRGDKGAQAEGHFHLACVQRIVENEQEVISHCRQALDIIEALWSGVTTDEHRLEYVTKFSAPSRMLVGALSREGNVKQALEEAERGRSRALDVLLLRQRQDPVGPGSAWARRLLARGERGTLSTAGFPAGHGFDAMREIAIIGRAAIVMFTCADTSSGCQEILAWVVGSTGDLTFKRLHLLPEIGSLTQLVELTRRACNIPPRRSSPSSGLYVDESKLTRDMAALTAEDEPNKPEVASTLLRQCHQLLIEPLEAALAREDRLLILPDLQLYALPFAALQDSRGRYLIETHMLTVAPSIATVLELQGRLTYARRATPGRRSLVVGNPNFCGRAQQLGGALAEAKRVHALLGDHGRPAVLLTHDEATKDAVKDVIRTSDIVHLATHGRPDGVLLAGTTAQTGLLSMSELQSLKLQSSPLIVLSACNTFGGELGTDGLIGIARSCLAAGASSLLASLWPVDDEPTSELMVGFYERVLVGDAMDVAAALQGAMIALLRRGAPVHHWAAFVAYGLQCASKAKHLEDLYKHDRWRRDGVVSADDSDGAGQ